MKINRYFMYGILVPYSKYLEINTINTIEDVLEGSNDIQGIFTGRDSDFMIIGKVIETVENDKPHIIPELNDFEMNKIKNLVNEKYELNSEFHYYFVTKVK